MSFLRLIVNYSLANYDDEYLLKLKSITGTGIKDQSFPYELMASPRKISNTRICAKETRNFGKTKVRNFKIFSREKQPEIRETWNTYMANYVVN